MEKQMWIIHIFRYNLSYIYFYRNTCWVRIWSNKVSNFDARNNILQKCMFVFKHGKATFMGNGLNTKS